MPHRKSTSSKTVRRSTADDAPPSKPTRKPTKTPRPKRAAPTKTTDVSVEAVDVSQPPREADRPVAGPVVPWTALGLSEASLESVRRNGFETPTDIQRELIPVALTGRDVLGQAKTGTGKTAAFSLPMLDRLKPGGGLQAIVLAPTRELAQQVDEHVKKLSPTDRSFHTVLILGGRRINDQVAALKRKPEIAIGTPGRVLDLMGRRQLDLSGITMVVLDEVDRMLDIGFRDDIRKILTQIKGKHQTIFVSATIDEEINKLARTYMRDPLEVNVSRDVLTVPNVRHGYVTVAPQDKLDTLRAFLKSEQPTLAIVFTNTKAKAHRVARQLKESGVNCKEIHGDLVQEKRDRVMKQFRSQQINVLVATDLASRGLDVLEVSHVVNYDIPEDSASYIHRIGRTARAGRSGYAVAFVTPEEGKWLTEVEKRINAVLERFEAPWVINRVPIRKAVSAEHAAPVQPMSANGVVVPPRLREVHTPDTVLEGHYGLTPKPRTLGSRFRSARKFRR